MTTGVIGGTGMLGSKVVELLAADGVEVRMLSRTAPKQMATGVTHRTIDLATGDGLETGLGGLDTVIDAGNTRKDPEDTLVEGTRRLLDICAGQGLSHYVGISILGCEKLDIGYYRAKAAQEEVIRSSPVGWSLLRATQFHELIDMIFQAAASKGVTPMAKIPLQPVAARVVAARLVALGASTPTVSNEKLTGPRIMTVSEMARDWRRIKGRRTIPLPLPVFGTAMKGLKSGQLVDSANQGSGPDFPEWLLANSAN